jgi:hypothetical protein
LIGKEIPSTVIPGIETAELEYDKRHSRGPRPGARSARDGASPAHPVVTPFPYTAKDRRAANGEAKGQDHRKVVVGFGDHLPAFLSRPPRIIAYP